MTPEDGDGSMDAAYPIIGYKARRQQAEEQWQSISTGVKGTDRRNDILTNAFATCNSSMP